MINNHEAVLEKRQWNTSLVFDAGRRKSELCKAKDFQTDWYKRWCNEIGETPRYHRKQWEYAYVMQALWERDCIQPGKKRGWFLQLAQNLFLLYLLIMVVR